MLRNSSIHECIETQISAIEYDETGDYLAAGDRTGQVTVYSRNQHEHPPQSPTRQIKLQTGGPQYSYHTEFKSHDAEFDYLKSVEIEEKINKIKWCKRSNNSLFLLSTNGMCIDNIEACLEKDHSYHNAICRQNDQIVEDLRQENASGVGKQHGCEWRWSHEFHLSIGIKVPNGLLL